MKKLKVKKKKGKGDEDNDSKEDLSESDEYRLPIFPRPTEIQVTKHSGRVTKRPLRFSE
jgi:hypothetical protein